MASRGSGHKATAGALSAELEALTLRALRVEHRSLNGSLFGHRLSCPAFALSDSRARLGQWLPSSKTIEVSRHLLVQMSWGVLVEVLKHEMAHQYVDEVLRADEAAHGPAFRRVCAERGIDARATGTPDAPGGSDTPAEEQAALEKISRLLTLAGSDNVHEAEAAMAAAQRLMLKYNLEAAARQPSRDYCFKQVGKPTGRVFEAPRILALILSEHFFVETIWVSVWRPLEGKRGSVIELCGTRANVEMAEYVHDFLTAASERLWREHKRNHGIEKDRDRRVFLAGVMEGFRKKLGAERSSQKQAGLVWRGDPALSGYLRERHPRMQWTRYASSAHEAAHAHGQRAGSTIVLHKGISSSGAARDRGRLLGS